MKKILIVADLKTFIEKEKSILNRAAFKLLTSNSSKEALDILRAEKIDLIITDLDMPVISGDSLCSIIRKDEELRKVSIIIVCTNRESDIERCTNCKANSYITRPINPDLLLEKVNQLLNISGRTSYRVLIEISVKGKRRNEFFFCNSRDISTSGILIETDTPLAKGDIISCSFFLPNSIRIIIDGEIVRVVKKTVKTSMYGINFSKLSPDSKSAIEAFIKNRSQNTII